MSRNYKENRKKRSGMMKTFNYSSIEKNNKNLLVIEPKGDVIKKERVKNMSQLSLFDSFEDDFEDDNETKEKRTVILKNVLSPLESKEKINSRKYREQQLEFSSYVHAIQSYHNCTWFKARELFFEHRDQQKPICMAKRECWRWV